MTYGVLTCREGCPSEMGDDPRTIEQLPGRLDFKNSLVATVRRAESLCALIGAIDPALVVGLAFALIGGPRQ